ncbi:acyl-CoA dehydrogenase family protein, partial [Streptomyces sp. NRRL F-3273]|uniref:acyl-CoA dehydrogenase family protein n=1 Tax=Streptomyces sp. NRRL F-3273 TaxID=1463848 RepID=UPI0004CB8A48
AGAAQYLDWYNPMTYDFFGAFAAQGPTAPHSPLTSYSGIPQEGFNSAAAIAKLYSTEAAVTATRIATQVFGGKGFMEEYPVARFYRDAKILAFRAGTSEVQRMLIARGLG